MRCIPVGKIENVALVRSCNDKIIITYGHIDDAIFELKILIHLGQNVRDHNFILVIQICLPVVVANLFVDHFSEDDITRPTRTCTECTIG